jgi:hypothetical protein
MNNCGREKRFSRRAKNARGGSPQKFGIAFRPSGLRIFLADFRNPAT